MYVKFVKTTIALTTKQVGKETTMGNAKLFYSTKPREFVADAYASQIKSDVWEKLSKGFECKTIAEFYKECSPEELEEVTQWNHTVFGKALCDEVDQAIDIALSIEETEISNVNWFAIIESSWSGQLMAVLFLDDPDHKKTKHRREMLKNRIYY